MGIDLHNPLHVLAIIVAIVLVLWIAGGIIGWAIHALIVITIVGGAAYLAFLGAKALGIIK